MTAAIYTIHFAGSSTITLRYNPQSISDFVELRTVSIVAGSIVAFTLVTLEIFNAFSLMESYHRMDIELRGIKYRIFFYYYLKKNFGDDFDFMLKEGAIPIWAYNFPVL